MSTEMETRAIKPPISEILFIAQLDPVTKLGVIVNVLLFLFFYMFCVNVSIE